MKLYQINQSQYPNSVEQDWQASLKQGDAVLFLETGVMRALLQPDTLTGLQDKQIKVFVRQADLSAYGIESNIGEAISDLQWVELTQQYSKIVSW